MGHFARAGAEVANFDLVPPRNQTHLPHWRRVDILDFDSLYSATADFNPEIVLHFGARTDLHGRSPEDYAANTTGVLNLIECLKSVTKPRLVLFSSSMLVCRLGYVPKRELDFCPTTPYGLSKCRGEKLIREQANSAFPWIILRPTSLWGPWFSTPYHDFFFAIQRGLYLHPRGKEVRRSYGFVLNSVHQIAQLVNSTPANLLGRSIYLADYEPTELGAWAREIQRHLDAPRIREVSPKLLLWAAILGDSMKKIGWRSVPLTTFRLRNLLTEAIYDTADLEVACGPVPYTMSEGVAMTCDWMRAQTSAPAQRMQ